jgi:hypothetical protein
LKVIFLAKEARFVIVAALHDVQGNTIKVDSGAAWHAGTLARNIEPGRFNSSGRSGRGSATVRSTGTFKEALTKSHMRDRGDLGRRQDGEDAV